MEKNKKILFISVIALLVGALIMNFASAWGLIELSQCSIKVSNNPTRSGVLTGLAEFFCAGNNGIEIWNTHACFPNGFCFDSISQKYYFNNTGTNLTITTGQDGSYDITSTAPVTINGKGVCLQDGTSSNGGVC